MAVAPSPGRTVLTPLSVAQPPSARAPVTPERRDVIPMQPTEPLPVRTKLTRMSLRSGEVVSALYREWRPGETGKYDNGCARCPTCTAQGDSCLLLVDVSISPQEAATWSARSIGARLIT